MKKLLLTTMFCAGLVAAVEAAPTDAVTQADLQALRALIEQQNAKIEAQAKRIAELEGRQVAARPSAAEAEMPKIVPSEDTKTNETGRIWTLGDGSKFYLADVTAGIFQPLSESGLRITPYGYLTFEAVHNTHKTETDIYTDWVLPRRNGMRNGDHQTVFSMNDSIIGMNFDAPESYEGWKFGGKFEFDLAGSNANDPDFHFRHLYFAMDNEDKGWNILFGQTWHLWKMVSPQEIDGAWMENTGYPYRRSPQIRVTKRFTWEDSSLEIRAGIVKNGNGMGGDRDYDYNQDNAASVWGLLEGAVVYDRKAFWEDSDRRWLVGLGGMYGRDKSHRFWTNDAGLVEYGQSDEYDTDMVMLAGSLPFFGKFKVTGQLFAGENLSGVQAGIGQGVSMPDPTRKGREVSTIGGFVDLRYDCTEKWAFAIGYGFDDPTDSEAKNAEDRVFNERVYADVFYQFNDNLHFGLEYAHLRTKYFYEGDADDDRIQFTAFFDF
ncbi:MAG: hypothetical protein IJ658_04295 [Kiritimatiellae bacterium]|nr:hypothetical protein [Kiritimatiellia bacterium]